MQLFKKVKFAVVAAQIGGTIYMVSEIKRRIYRKEIFIGLEKYLTEPDPEIDCDVKYSLSPASFDDMVEVFSHIKGESQSSLFDLIQRKWFYDSGFQNCYIARIVPTNQICYMEWIVSLRDNNSGNRIFKTSFPWLGEGDVQFEHSYTFERYRGKHIMPSVTRKLFNVARAQGFKRVIGYVLADNPTTIRSLEKVGFRSFEAVRRTKFLFYIRYKKTKINKFESASKMAENVLLQINN